jgi:cytoskeletal protein RodZ
MNPQMRLVIMLAVLGASGSLLFAAEPAAPPADDADKTEKVDKTKSAQTASEPAAGAKQGTDKENGAEAVPAEDEDPAPKGAPTAADKAGSPQRFTPSEQVRADFDVSFPVDI